jgi:hypothetical protein
VSLETNPTGTVRSARPRAKPVQRKRLAAEITKRFRMPGTADPKVRLRRLAGVAVWAAVLGFSGLIVGFRVVIGLFTSSPSWYAPTICAIGLAGIAITVGAFASVHRRKLPWLLLGLATVTLVVAWVVSNKG